MEIDLIKKISEPIFFVTNDVSRAIGLEKLLPNYHIVCLDDHPLIDYLQKEGVSIFCLERELNKKNALVRNTGVILSHPLVVDFIKNKSKGHCPNILFFKPQKRIEVIAKNEGYNPLGNSSEINAYFEDKISFFSLCRRGNIPMPEGEICNFKEVNFEYLKNKYGIPFVVQYGRGWAGNTTFFISTKSEFELLGEKSVVSKIKISRYIKGITVLNNAVIFGNHVFFSRPAVQIKSNGLLSSLPAATGGRQWPADLTDGQQNKIAEITQKTGELMILKGYKGFFGLDFIVEEKSGNVYLSENNSRLTASCPFYTKLELEKNQFPLLGYHIFSFLKNDMVLEKCFYPQPDLLGSELVVRNREKKKITVISDFKPGLYRQSDLSFVEESYFLNKIESGLFWLTTAARGRTVNPEIELLRMNFFRKICKTDGSLSQEDEKLVKNLLAKIIKRNV